MLLTPRGIGVFIPQPASTSSSTTMARARKQVCLFGLSADPPTGDSGHTGIVKALAAMDEFDEIRVLPVYRHNFSEKRNRLASFDQRVEMCRLAFSVPKVTVSESERDCFQKASKGMNAEDARSMRVGTADLLEMLLEQEPDTDFTFCLGSDTFIDLMNWKWKRSKDVLSLLRGRILVIDRPNGATEGLQQRIENINKAESASVRLLQITTLGTVSSTMIRCCRDEETLRKLLSPSVLDYIKEKAMYSFSET